MGMQEWVKNKKKNKKKTVLSLVRFILTRPFHGLVFNSPDVMYVTAINTRPQVTCEKASSAIDNQTLFGDVGRRLRLTFWLTFFQRNLFMLPPPKLLNRIQPNLFCSFPTLVGCARAHFGPSPRGPGEGSKDQITIKFNYTDNFLWHILYSVIVIFAVHIICVKYFLARQSPQ